MLRLFLRSDDQIGKGRSAAREPLGQPARRQHGIARDDHEPRVLLVRGALFAQRQLDLFDQTGDAPFEA
jgi:hypothetical protein